ncbi:MAG TPA: helix-turn-helix domain-containing protein [Flavisolibacter sp.]|jgi:transcriptional regulator GlxA family with amidase domain|nr:helix-turn-helix domain-containing protein [Flavisolibacter sp.]
MKQAVIVIPRGSTNLSSVTGSYEILTRANRYWQRCGNPSRLDICIAGYDAGVPLHEGLFTLHPTDIRKIVYADLVLIPSLSYDYDTVLQENDDLIGWIRCQYKQGAEIASICTGAFLLAATGILEGRTCSTHWNAASDFRRLFPGIDLQIDQLVTANKGIYTNGGAYSFLNLILFLVEKYFDRATAIYCSKVFQIDIERSVQSPFAIFETQKQHGDELIAEAQRYIEENLNQRISFERLAGQLATSRRNFDRRFIRATGNTPVEYLQRVKIEVAKQALEKGRKTLYEIMEEIGYTDDKAFREVFRKIVGMSPLGYRSRFHKESVDQLS